MLTYGIPNNNIEYYAENENVNATTVVILNSETPGLCLETNDSIALITLDFVRCITQTQPMKF